MHFHKEIKPIVTFSLFFLVPIIFLIFHFQTSFNPLTFLHPFFESKANLENDFCDYSNGKWVWDASFDGWYTEKCRFLDPGFQCRKNGRNDTRFLHWRWKPHGCDLPQFNAKEMLERSRNKRIVFVGDSIGRNQWESFVCMLSTNISNPSNIYEQFGNPISKHRGFLSMVFKDYNLTVEYYRAPQIVVVDRFPPRNMSFGVVRGAIRVDKLPRFASRWAGADVLVLNSGHWWNIDKTLKLGHYFQVGQAINETMDIKEAFQRSMDTIKSWALNNPKFSKSHIFLRSYAPSHFINGTWETHGTCAFESDPYDDTKNFQPESWTNQIVASTIKDMRNHGMRASVLNVTYMTEFRKDGHPSAHREPGMPPRAPEDCSHWCLPGVPDAWNELLYANLLSFGSDEATTL
ncbi:Protein trichome birefringence [Rhynchospora pubera]|uniref:Protein trichome birefringence n=1 Tax=Rhynchospora pubera TaxID=906938 RepID=A0AAV8DKI5_9POAL|nr:Protein trichome birefringence [Rhynchospora pubera]